VPHLTGVIRAGGRRGLAGRDIAGPANADVVARVPERVGGEGRTVTGAAPRSSGPAAGRRRDLPPVVGDARLDALIRRLSAPATAAELGDEPRIRALFQAVQAGRPPVTPGTPTPSATPAEPAVAGARRWPGLGVAMNHVADGAAVAIAVTVAITAAAAVTVVIAVTVAAGSALVG
jgi:hypothetical protein